MAKTLTSEQLERVLRTTPGITRDQAMQRLRASGFTFVEPKKKEQTKEAQAQSQPEQQKRLTPNDIMIGQMKGVGSSLLGLAQLGQRGLSAVTGIKPVGGQEQLTQGIEETRQQYLRPKNIAEQAGFIGEQVSEMVIPTPARVTQAAKAIPFVSKLAQRAPTVSKILGGVGTALREGAETAAVGAAQSGSTENVAQDFAIGSLVPASIRGVGSLAKETAKVLSSRLGGYPAAALEEAFKNPQAVSKAIRDAAKQGENAPLQVLRNADDALKEVKLARNNAYADSLKEIEESVLKREGDKWLVLDETTGAYKPVDISTKGVKDVTTSVLKDFNVKGSRGKFDFFESRLRPKEGTINEIVDTVYKWDDVSPTGLNRLRQIIGDYKITNPTVTADRQFNAFVDSLSKNIDNYVGDRVPQIKSMNKAYAVESDFIDSLQSEILNPNAKESTRITKLMNVFKVNNPLSTSLIKQLGAKTGTDIKADIAGVLLSRFAPEGLLGTMGANFFTTGAILNPALLTAAPFFSPRIAGEVASGFGKAKAGIEGAINLGIPMLRGGVSNILRKEE